MTGTDATHWEKALALQDHGQALAAVRELRELGRRLVRQRQDLAGILETARQLFGLYDHGTALNLLDASVRLAGKQPALLLRLAMLLVTESRFAEAARFARGALAQGNKEAPVEVDARLLLAECLERTGHSAEAAALVEEILKTHPASIPAHRLKAVLLRRQGNPQAALEVLRDLLEKGGPPHWETCRAWFELGQVQDQLGDYAGAWRSWVTARRFHAPDIDWSMRRGQAEHVWNHVRSLHRSLDGEHMARWRAPDPQEEKPSSAPPRLAVLTGHPRSGTTLLEQALDAHSGIVSMEETTLFTSNVYRPLFQHGPQGATPAQRLDTMPERELRHWRRQYLGLSRLALGQDPGSRLVLDKNPDLLQLLPAWRRIFPEARVIVMLRDPRDLLVSMFSQALPPNHTAWSYRTPEAAAEMVSLRLGLWHHLRKRLPDDAFHEVRYERLVADFAGETGRVLACLSLEPEPATLRPEVHSRQKTVCSPTYAAVQSPVHSRAVARWRNYSRWLAPLMKTLRPAIQGLGYVEEETE